MARTVGEDRWLRSMSSFSEGDLSAMLLLALQELAYRHRTSTADLLARLGALPEPWRLTIDAQSGAEKLTLTLAGQLWEGVTGRKRFARSSACSSLSSRLSSSSTRSRTG